MINLFKWAITFPVEVWAIIGQTIEFTYFVHKVLGKFRFRNDRKI
jgi:hypothetical protein